MDYCRHKRITRNSIRFKEVPEPGKAEVLGSIYLQKWLAGNAKSIEVSVKVPNE